MATAPSDRPNPNEKLVRVFDSDQESEALVVRGLLEANGIQCDMVNLEAPQDVLPGVGGIVILVREEDAGQARRVIAESQESASTDEEGNAGVSE